MTRLLLLLLYQVAGGLRGVGGHREHAVVHEGGAYMYIYIYIYMYVMYIYIYIERER